MTVSASQHAIVRETRPACGKCCDTCVCLPESERPVPRPGLIGQIREDIQTVFIKDPAARSTIEVLTCYPGLHAIWLYRVAHVLWVYKLRFWARLLSHIARWLTGIEIHPGATIGRRVFIDHGMGVVIGETAEVGNDVLIYKGVVLGGVSLEKVKRHPTIGNGVVLGTDAIVLGPIDVGYNAQIGSGSVVVKPVPPCATVVGVPGRVVKLNGVSCRLKPDLHHEQLPDMVIDTIDRLTQRITVLEARLSNLESLAPPVEGAFALEEVKS
ncbi:MAG: serine O-acetyltransferase [Anaerolineae bacterium]|nr:serine O-acetyltransferase [Anaerolineae bacterium]